MQKRGNRDWMNALAQWECRDSSYQGAEPPLVFARAKGSIIWDSEDRPYIDLCAGFGVTALGHNNDVQKRVFAESFSGESSIIHGMGDVYPSIAKVALLERLGSLLPSFLEKGALALSGGQAVEIAVKTAQIASGKQGFITFADSYHGLDLGILPLTSRRDFKEPFAAWIPGEFVSELPYGSAMETLKEAIATQRAGGFGTAAVIVEPIQGRAGIRLPPAGWLKDLSDLCRAEGVLLIYDEIFCGLGRTGRMTFAEDVPCDLLCLGKALGGGLPLSACFGRREIMDAWPQNAGEAIHTGTFFGHPLSCRLGLATLNEIETANLLQRSRDLGQRIRNDLQRVFRDSPQVKAVRGEGLMIGLELEAPGKGARLMDRLRAEGVIALASGTYGEGISITPALTFPEELWQEALAVLQRVLCP